jgi:hypothetical protein
MKKLLWLCAAALLVPASAFAVGGVDLAWVDCETGVRNVNFVCTGTANTNSNLMLYVKPNIPLPNFVGIRMDVDLQTNAEAPLPPFYHYEQGGCQRPGGATPNGVAISDNISAAGATCQNYADPWGGDGSAGFEGIATYIPDDDRPGNGHFVLGVASSGSVPLDAKVNMYAAHMTFSNRHRNASAGNPQAPCAGCGTPAVMIFNSATLESNDGTPAQEIAFTAGKGGDCVTINGGDAGRCANPTPTRNATWGQVKSIYR